MDELREAFAAANLLRKEAETFFRKGDFPTLPPTKVTLTTKSAEVSLRYAVVDLVTADHDRQKAYADMCRKYGVILLARANRLVAQAKINFLKKIPFDEVCFFLGGTLHYKGAAYNLE
jgi:hypothetical protein